MFLCGKYEGLYFHIGIGDKARIFLFNANIIFFNNKLKVLIVVKVRIIYCLSNVYCLLSVISDVLGPVELFSLKFKNINTAV